MCKINHSHPFASKFLLVVVLTCLLHSPIKLFTWRITKCQDYSCICVMASFYSLHETHTYTHTPPKHIYHTPLPILSLRDLWEVYPPILRFFPPWVTDPEMLWMLWSLLSHQSLPFVNSCLMFTILLIPPHRSFFSFRVSSASHITSLKIYLPMVYPLNLFLLEYILDKRKLWIYFLIFFSVMLGQWIMKTSNSWK